MQPKPQKACLHAINSSFAMTTSVLAAEPMSLERLYARHVWQVSWLADSGDDGGGPKPVAPDRAPAGLSRLPGNTS